MHPEQIGPYTILDELGKGGMGSVYLGRHKETGQVAAVKIMPAAHARHEGFVERFSREIEAMRKLNNPHIVKLYDSGDDEGVYYYSMEYVPGETIMSLLRREKRIEWERAVEYTIQICQALKAAHDAGIIHRDLKPSNLLLTPDGIIKLTDFGVAQVFAADRLTITGGVIGTAEFMSPEQASGKRVTRQSDLYALGAVLYCLVTGRPPFSGNAAIDVIQKHKFGMYDKPRLIEPDIPVWLEEIICQLLEKDPDKRPPDALVLMRRLKQMQDRYQNPITSEVTLAIDATSDATAPTVVSDDDDVQAKPRQGPGPATMMREGIRAALEDTPSPIAAVFNNVWVLLVLLVLIVGGTVWFMTRPPDSESTAEDPGDIDPRILKLQVSLKSHKDLVPADDPSRQLLRIQEALNNGDRAGALRMASALQTVLGTEPQWARERELAAALVERLSAPPAATQYAAAEAALTRADAEFKAGKTTVARGIWQSIVDLYAPDRDAAQYVEQARKRLEATESK